MLDDVIPDNSWFVCMCVYKEHCSWNIVGTQLLMSVYWINRTLDEINFANMELNSIFIY